MKVLFVHEHPDNIAGQELSLRDRIIGLRDLGIDCLVLLPAEGVFAALLRSLEAPVRIVPLRHLSRRNPLPFLRTVWRLARFIRREAVDIVHCSGAYPCQYALPAARLSGVPCVVHINTTVYSRRCLQKNFVCRADLIIAISEAVRRNVLALSPACAQRVQVVYNGISDPGCRPDEAAARVLRGKYGLGDGWKAVGQFAAVIPRKGYEYFISAAGRVVPRFPRVKFFIVGRLSSCEYEQRLRDLVREQGLGDHVVFAGFQGNVTSLMDMMDVTVLYSCQEGLGRVVIESQMKGRPVIGADVEGIAESVEHGKTGLLVPPRNDLMLAEAILDLLNDPQQCLRLSAQAREPAVRRHDVHNQAQVLAGCYQRLLHPDASLSGRGGAIGRLR